VIVLALYGIARAVVVARLPLLLTFLAIVLSALLCYPIDWISRRLPRVVGVLATVVLFAGILVGLGFWLTPVIRGQVEQLPEEIAAARARLEDLSTSLGFAHGKPQPHDVSTTVAHTLPIAFGTIEALTGILYVVILAFFLAATRAQLHRGIRRLLPPARVPAFDTWWSRIGAMLRRWTGGIVVAMAIMGLVTGLGLWIAGISSPLLLGILTFFGTFVPYVGAIASAIPGLAIALAQSPRHFFFAGVVYVVVHHVEGYLVQPLVMRRAVALSPALLLFSEAVAAALFGIPGVIVATPLLACIQATVELFWLERPEARVHETP